MAATDGGVEGGGSEQLGVLASLLIECCVCLLNLFHLRDFMFGLSGITLFRVSFSLLGISV